MKEIKLTRGKVALVDNEDFNRLAQFKWHTSKRDHLYYARRTGGRLMHNEIANPPSGHRWDHRDGDGLNNQKTNLRPND